MPRTSNFYGLQAWKRIREQVFKRDEFRCRDCSALGKQAGGQARLTADHAGISLRSWEAKGNRPEDYPLHWIVTRCDVCHGRKDGGRGQR